MRGMDFNFERWARASGVGFVVVAVAAFVVMGEVPKVNDTPDKLISFYDGDRSRVLFGAVLWGIAMILLAWFIGAIANILRESGEGRLAGTGLVLGGAFVGAQMIATAIVGTLALNIAAAGDAGVIQALHTLQWSVDSLSGIVLAGLIAAATIGLVRSGRMADWFGAAGAVAAVVALLHGTNLAKDGFWAPGGGWTIITIIVTMLWTVVTSVLLVREYGRAHTTMPTMPPPATGNVAA